MQTGDTLFKDQVYSSCIASPLSTVHVCKSCARAIVVEDDLVRAAKDAFASYLRRFLVLLVDFKEASALAYGLSYGLLLVGPSGLQDTLGLAARFRNNLAGIGASFVLQALFSWRALLVRGWILRDRFQVGEYASMPAPIGYYIWRDSCWTQRTPRNSSPTV